ncbi:unnamed protein product [Echinostoma caproni]|uniref:CUB domain-containing protein n=1 Tax=Echinostoma caproni TaxID=27848 RepID=A0A183AAV6_9TREM|nr:unnamed protein product [Echinostoma caproni]
MDNMWRSSIAFVIIINVFALASADDKECGQTASEASETLTKLVLPSTRTEKCQWTISTHTQRFVHLSRPASTTATSKEEESTTNCITLSDGTSSRGDWCDQEYEQKIDFKEKIIIQMKSTGLPAAKAALQDIPLYFQLVNDPKCTEKVNAPTELKQYFNITKEHPIVPKIACVWLLKSSSDKKLEISLDAKTPVDMGQCITVSYAGSTDAMSAKRICCQEGNNVFTAEAGKDITVAFESSSEEGTFIDNFKVYYQLVSDKVENNRCNEIPGPPTNNDQSFTVAESGDTIPAGLVCTWNISTSGGKSIRVSLDVEPPKTEKNCIRITNEDKSGAKEICGKEQSSTFTSNGLGVVVSYDGKTAASADQANFKIHYQFGQFQ